MVLRFFSSNLEAKQFIASGVVRVNTKKVSNQFELSKGDVVTIDLDALRAVGSSKIRKKHSKTRTVFSFIEVDYYTGSIVIIKNARELDLQDYALIIQDHLYIKSLTQNF